MSRVKSIAFAHGIRADGSCFRQRSRPFVATGTR